MVSDDRKTPTIRQRKENWVASSLFFKESNLERWEKRKVNVMENCVENTDFAYAATSRPGHMPRQLPARLSGIKSILALIIHSNLLVQVYFEFCLYVMLKMSAKAYSFRRSGLSPCQKSIGHHYVFAASGHWHCQSRCQCTALGHRAALLPSGTYLLKTGRWQLINKEKKKEEWRSQCGSSWPLLYGGEFLKPYHQNWIEYQILFSFSSDKDRRTDSRIRVTS